MIKYLLLRDNKESGPYSFDDLKQKGLKAYDLVWVEGKSAAWRYPCEVEELKSFAPAVEEQPFDRFFRRPSQENTTSTPAIIVKQASIQEPVSRVSLSVIGPSLNGSSVTPGSGSIFSGEPSTVPGKRIIYVTLPAGKGIPVSKETPPRETVKIPAPAIYQPAVAAIAVPAAEEENSTQIHEDRITFEEELPRFRQKSKLTGVFQPLMVAASILALLAAGIFIGLSINKDHLGYTQKIAANNNKGGDKPPSGIIPSTGSLPPSSNTPALQVQAGKTDTALSVQADQTAITVAPVVKKTSSPREKATLPVQKAAATSAKDSLLIGLPVTRREASHRVDQTTGTIDKDVLRTNLSNLVSIGANGYSVGTFGGITGIQLTVSNKSVYPLDLVVVEVQYIQANKKVFKTESLSFRGIGPGSALMQPAPNSTRGIKVQYKITLINSKELGLSYSAL